MELLDDLLLSDVWGARLTRLRFRCRSRPRIARSRRIHPYNGGHTMSPEQGAEPAGKSLFSLQRREKLMEELRAHGAISVRAIAAKLGVSELTIRRDVNILADEGLVSRVHGGATLPSPLDRTAAGTRQQTNGTASAWRCRRWTTTGRR